MQLAPLAERLAGTVIHRGDLNREGYTDVQLEPGLVLLGKPFRLKELRDCVEAATARG